MNGDEEKIAVFIDGENINSKDFCYINSEIKKHGKIVFSYIYGDWSDSNVHKWINIAQTNGIQKIQCDKTNKKNSVDIKMSIDIMKFLFFYNHIDTFVLVTSDSDFRHVIFEIKNYGKKVYCIGSSRVNIGLTSTCDKYIVIDDIKNSENNINSSEKCWEDIKNYLVINDIANLSYIKLIICNNFPSFDHRNYGYEKFSDFVRNNYSNLKVDNEYVKLSF